MNKTSTIPDWIKPKELIISWPDHLPSGVGTRLLPFYKRLIKTINNVSIRILINSDKISKTIYEGNNFIFKINSGDVWLRDFMPIAAKQVNYLQYHKFKYNPAYLGKKDELIKQLGDSTPIKLTEHFLNRNLYYENLILDGGNFISNGIGVAITTNRIISDNQHFSIYEIKSYFKNRMGIDKLIILPVEPGDITGHVDGMVRFISESLVVVGDYPSSYSIGKEFMNRIAKTIKQSGFKVIRILNDVPAFPKRKFPSAVGNYINFLRVANTIYLPVYKNKDELNKRAIALYESLNLKVIPVYSDELAEFGGILNCITWHYY